MMSVVFLPVWCLLPHPTTIRPSDAGSVERTPPHGKGPGRMTIIWEPDDYVGQFYAPDRRDDTTMAFIIDELADWPGGGQALDLGAGVTVAYWAAAAAAVDQMTLADYTPAYLEAQRRWIERAPGAPDWSNYIGMALRYAGLPSDPAAVAERTALVRSRATALVPCDLTQPDPLGAAHRSRYDLVLGLYCAESIAGSHADWRSWMRNAFSLVRPGGRYIGAALGNCSYYCVGAQRFGHIAVSAADYRAVMLEHGFTAADLHITTAPEQFPDDPEQARRMRAIYGYDETIFAAGRLAGAPDVTR